MIEMACPHCGAAQKLRPESAGERLTCQACGKAFRVPLASAGWSSTEKRSEPSRDEFDFSEPPREVSAAPSSTKADPASALATGSTASEPFELIELELEAPADPIESKVAVPARASDRLGGSASEGEKKTNGAGDLAASIGRPPLEPLRLDDSVGSGSSDESEIRVCCPICEGVTWVKSHKAGKQIVCSDCGTTVEVPAQKAPPLSPPKPKTVAPSRWREDEPRVTEAIRSDSENRTNKIDSKQFVGVARKWGEAPPKEEATAQEQDPVERVLRSRKLVDEPLYGATPKAEERRSTDVVVPRTIDQWLQQSASVFASPSVLGAALLVGLIQVLSLFVTLLLLTGQSEEDPNPLAMYLGWGLSLPVSILWLLLVSIVAGTVVADTANGAKSVESWPSFEPSEIIRAALPFLVPLIVTSLPVLLLERMVLSTGAPWWIASWIAPVVRWALLPVLLLSSLRAGSVVNLVHPPTIQLLKSSSATRTYYLLSGVLLFAAYLADLIALGVGSLMILPCGFILGVFWVLHARLLGLLLRVIESEHDEAAAR